MRLSKKVILLTDEIRTLYADGMTMPEICEELGLNRATVAKILHYHGEARYRTQRFSNPVDRFMEKIEYDLNGGCWLWSASLTEGGYGQFYPYIGDPPPGETKRPHPAHRVAYRLFVGDIPVGLDVRHKCDVRPCCNPDHLEVGTRQENIDDMMRRGRNSKGEDRSHLKNHQVLDMRRRFNSGESQASIAKLYGVSSTTVNGIVRRRTWTHLP